MCAHKVSLITFPCDFVIWKYVGSFSLRMDCLFRASRLEERAWEAVLGLCLAFSPHRTPVLHPPLFVLGGGGGEVPTWFK